MGTTELPSAWLSHRIAGRTRLHVPQMRGQRAYFADVRESLIHVSGIRRVSTNVRTGSILVEHGQARVDLGQIGAERGLFRIEPEPPKITLSERVRRAEHRADSMLVQTTGGRVDLPGATALTYMGLGVFQIARGGELLPAAFVLVAAAISTLRKIPD
jgi:hypothetical protein